MRERSDRTWMHCSVCFFGFLCSLIGSSPRWVCSGSQGIVCRSQRFLALILERWGRTSICGGHSFGKTRWWRCVSFSGAWSVWGVAGSRALVRGMVPPTRGCCRRRRLWARTGCDGVALNVLPSSNTWTTRRSHMKRTRTWTTSGACAPASNARHLPTPLHHNHNYAIETTPMTQNLPS